MNGEESDLRFSGRFVVDCLDEQGDVLWHETIANDPTLVGLTTILQDYFNAGTQKPNWYMGLIDGATYTSVSPEDTMASHPGWTELTSYTAATRPAYAGIAIANGVMRNNTAAQFQFNSNAQVRGIFLVSHSAKGGTSGVLWNRGIFTVVRTLGPSQTLHVTYLLRASGSAG